MSDNLTLPVIDITPYLSGGSTVEDAAKRRECSSAIHAACSDVGFFYLDVSGYLTEEERLQVLKYGKAFFDLPQDEKERINIENSDGARGYQRLKQNITGGKADHHEGLDFYADSPYRGSEGQGKALSGCNQWPVSPPEFQTVFSSWIEKMLKLGRITMEAWHGLEMEEEEKDELLNMVDKSFWVMRVIGYPPLPLDSEGASCGAHKDYGCLTYVQGASGVCPLNSDLCFAADLHPRHIRGHFAFDFSLLHSDSTPDALQVFHRRHRSQPELNGNTLSVNEERESDEGVWINASPKRGCFVVNIGEMWEIWTAGLYKSTLHRVVHKSPSYRLSIPFFFEPNFDAHIRPLDAAIRKSEKEGPASDERGLPMRRYKDVVYGDFLIDKVGNNFIKDIAGRPEQRRY